VIKSLADRTSRASPRFSCDLLEPDNIPRYNVRLSQKEFTPNDSCLEGNDRERELALSTRRSSKVEEAARLAQRWSTSLVMMDLGLFVCLAVGANIIVT
jgi:hypothetical protein